MDSIQSQTAPQSADWDERPDWEKTAMRLAHELKNVLTRLEASKHLMQKLVQAQDHESTAPWEVHCRALTQLDQINRRLLELLIHRRTASIEPLSLDTVLAKVCEDFRETAQRASIQITRSISSNANMMVLDGATLAQALTNLVQNAFEACTRQNHAEIHLSAEVDEANERLLLSVEDNGPGIDASYVERVFCPTYSTKGSTGIGLFLAREIAESCGGTLTVTSRPGATCFVIALPLRSLRSELDDSEDPSIENSAECLG